MANLHLKKYEDMSSLQRVDFSVLQYADDFTRFIIIPCYTCGARLLEKLQLKILVWITDYFAGIGDGAKLILDSLSNQSSFKSISTHWHLVLF